MKSPLVPITIAFIFGILAASVMSVPIEVVFTLIMLVIFILARFRNSVPYIVTLLLLLWFFLGALRVVMWQRDPVNQIASALTDVPQNVSLHGKVTSDPYSKIRKDQTEVMVCELTLLHRKMDSDWVSSSGKLRAQFIDSREPLRYGDEILVHGQWSRVPAPTNPGQFNWQAALARKRIGGLLSVKPYEPVVIIKRSNANPVLSVLSSLRKRWAAVIDENFTLRDAGLLRSLILGQREELNPSLKESFVKTGTMHLLVISGFHIGIIGILLECVLRLLYLPHTLRMILSAVVLGGYCVLTGMSPPVVRATLMAWMVLGALALDRVIVWLNLLAMAALGILMCNPMQLYDPGFQLSFGAVVCILIFVPGWRPSVISYLKWIRPNWLARYITFSICVTSAIWLGLSPVLARYFALVIPVSVVANLIIAPLMSGLVIGSLCMLVTASLFEFALPIFAVPINMLLAVIYFCVQHFHVLPGGHFSIARPTFFLLTVYYLLLGLTVAHRKLRIRKRHLLVLWICGGALGISGIVGKHLWQSRWCELVFLDVGHGDCAVIRSPGGKTVVIDAGTQDAGRFRVLPYLQEKGLMVIDWLIITHSDEDHIGGAIALLKTVKVKHLLTNGTAGDTMAYSHVMQLVNEKSIAHSVINAGTEIHAEPGFSIKVLHPPEAWKDERGMSSNDRSVVLMITHGNNRFLFTGDIEEEGLPVLMRNYHNTLQSRLIKIPHHGSRLGNIGEQFFNAVNPEIAVISVGRTHYLPASSTVEQLEKSGARVITTRDAGTIFIRSDGVDIKIDTFREL